MSTTTRLRVSRFLSLICLAAVLSLGLATGCQSFTSSTTQQTPEQVAKIAGVVEGFAATGTSLYLTKNAGSASYFTAAASIIEAAANAGVVDPQAVQAALAKQLEGDNAQTVTVALSAAFGLYQAFIGANVESKLDTKPAFKAALLAIARGIRTGAGPASVVTAGPPVSLKIPEDLVLR